MKKISETKAIFGRAGCRRFSASRKRNLQGAGAKQAEAVQFWNMISSPLAVYYEHPDWFRPLFAELEKRGIPFEKLPIASHFYDPAEKTRPFPVLFNRMSPSAYLRGVGDATFYTVAYLAHLERLGVRVINGSAAFGVEISKAKQITLMEQLGVAYPKARIIHHIAQAAEAAEGLRFPVVVKANVGGSGAGITRYETREDLEILSQWDGQPVNGQDLGVDGTALVQEFVPARNGHITRVETLNGKFLYAINVYASGDSFNLCPADICQTTEGVSLVRGACAVDAPKTGLTVENYAPPQSVIDTIEKLVRAAQIDVGGVEYMTDDRSGKIVYYDINALSNFVADAKNVIGFDPHERLVDFLVGEREKAN